MQFAERGNLWRNLSGAIVCKSSNVYISRLINKVKLYKPNQLKSRKQSQEDGTTSPYTSTPLVTQKYVTKVSVLKNQSPLKAQKSCDFLDEVQLTAFEEDEQLPTRIRLDKVDQNFKTRQASYLSRHIQTSQPLNIQRTQSALLKHMMRVEVKDIMESKESVKQLYRQLEELSQNKQNSSSRSLEKLASLSKHKYSSLVYHHHQASDRQLAPKLGLKSWISSRGFAQKSRNTDRNWTRKDEPSHSYSNSIQSSYWLPNNIIPFGPYQTQQSPYLQNLR